MDSSTPQDTPKQDSARQHPYPLPKFNMKELYNPTMVTIKVIAGDDDERVFTVQRDLISRHSDYFRAAFEGKFTEAGEGMVVIKEFSSGIVETFMDFLFHNEISQDGDEPTEWDFEYLISCYIFGDKYDSRGFRSRVVEAIQTKLLARTPRFYNFPVGELVHHLWNNTAASDPLRKLLVEAHITDFNPLTDDAKEATRLENYPADFVSQCLIFTRKIVSAQNCPHCRRDGDEEPCDSKLHNGSETGHLSNSRWCQYHQHDSDEEKRICEWRRTAVEWKFSEPPGDLPQG